MSVIINYLEVSRQNIFIIMERMQQTCNEGLSWRYRWSASPMALKFSSFLSTEQPTHQTTSQVVVDQPTPEI